MKIVYSIVTLFFIGWAFFEQTKSAPNIWVQIVGVILFFYAMMRLMSKVPSNTKSDTTRVNNTDENDK